MDKPGSPPRIGAIDPETLLDNVLDTMAGGLFTVDPTGVITSWNAAMEHMTGYSADEALGRRCSFLDGDTCFGGPSGAGQSQCAVFGGQPVRTKPCRIRDSRGRELLVVKNARVMRDERGEIVGAIESITDVTPVIELGEELARLRRRIATEEAPRRLVGEHGSMARLHDMIEVAAANDFPVLVLGETGTGKELVAQAVHVRSRRSGGPFVRVSCASLAETVLESELFGHVRGAFTGAVAARKGRFEEADGGTLMLDEIGDISPNVQKKLLRVLQESEFERVGDNRTIRVDIRVIAVTNRDLRAMVERGEFRSDLYYRLAVIPIEVPPLRDRVSDVPLLADFFVARLRHVLSREVQGFDRAAVEAMVRHTWPGNVRELQHAVEYAAALAGGSVIGVADLPPSITAPVGREVSTAGPRSRAPKSRAAVEAALHRAGGKRVDAARELGVSRVTLWKWMKEFGLGDD